MKTYTPQEWYDLASDIYDLAITEFNDPSYSQEKHHLYIKMVYAVNFFRMLRGEGFDQCRPHGMGELQQELYQKEDDLMNKLAQLKTEIDPANPASNFHLNEAKKDFSL